MSAVPFAKVQSIGNDFVLVEARHLNGFNLAELALKVTPRHTAIGSDGLLVVGEDEEGVWLRMFNPDGTEDFCGNGLRCTAHYAAARGMIGGSAVIRHLGKAVPVTVNDGLVTTILPPASFAPEAMPHRFGREIVGEPLEVGGETIVATSLSTGSAHTIIFVDALPDDERFHRVSEALEHHPIFPERTSTMWALRTGDRAVRLRIWERGAGETLGCGTGSCATAVAFCRRFGMTGAIEVQNPGGSVIVSLDDWSSQLHVSGTAEVVFEGVLSL